MTNNDSVPFTQLRLDSSRVFGVGSGRNNGGRTQLRDWGIKVCCQLNTNIGFVNTSANRMDDLIKRD